MRRVLATVLTTTALATSVLVGTAGTASAAPARDVAPTVRSHVIQESVKLLPSRHRKRANVRTERVVIEQASLMLNLPDPRVGTPTKGVDYTKSTLVVEVQLPSGCHTGASARVVRTTRNTVFVSASARRPAGRDVYCTAMVQHVPVTLTVPTTTRRVVDTTTGKPVQLMVAMP